MSVEELVRQLDAQKQAYFDTFSRLHEAFVQSLTASTDPATASPPVVSPPQPSGSVTIASHGIQARLQRSTSLAEVQRKHSGFSATVDASTVSDDNNEEEEEYFVQTTLPSHTFDHEDLRKHLKTYEWDQYGQQILASLITDHGRLRQTSLFHTGKAAEDRSHYSHYQVYDVGPDGSPLLVETSGLEDVSKATIIWHSIKDLNADASKQRQAVGRITIAREPSPILFGALHLTMHEKFDMDELFKYLVESNASSASVDRAFLEDPRRQRTIVFNFDYYTVCGEDCKPMTWQLADKHLESSDNHLPLARCSSVVALYLAGGPHKVRNSSRRAKIRNGNVYDPWASWQVLNIQCYPDWKATPDVHDSTKHYVNGPEAFLHTLLAEYRDAQKRFEEIYKGITKLITPPADFLFNDELRDLRLFEDPSFTYTRRYFWAHQTLGTMNDNIKVMIDAFEDTFTDEVWEGKSKTLWPLRGESPRNEFFKRRLRSLRLQFEREMNGLRTLIKENNDRRNEIRGLRDQLFSGTSVLESRKSVELSELTILQGHNIKLLTLVNMFFLPLTFVTSVFGMTNMPTAPHYWMFGITLATICVPSYLLIGSMNRSSGYDFWTVRTKALWRWIRRAKKVDNGDDEEESLEMDSRPASVARSRSTEQKMAKRFGRPPGGTNLRAGSYNLKKEAEGKVSETVTEQGKTRSVT